MRATEHRKSPALLFRQPLAIGLRGTCFIFLGTLLWGTLTAAAKEPPACVTAPSFDTSPYPTAPAGSCTITGVLPSGVRVGFNLDIPPMSYLIEDARGEAMRKTREHIAYITENKTAKPSVNIFQGNLKSVQAIEGTPYMLKSIDANRILAKIDANYTEWDAQLLVAYLIQREIALDAIFREIASYDPSNRFRYAGGHFPYEKRATWGAFLQEAVHGDPYDRSMGSLSNFLGDSLVSSVQACLGRLFDGDLLREIRQPDLTKLDTARSNFRVVGDKIVAFDL